MSVPLTPWLRDHRSDLAMSVLLSYAVPVTFFPGALSVMSESTPRAVGTLAAWFILYGAILSLSLVLLDHLLARHRAGHASWQRWLATTLAAGAAAAGVELATSGRGAITVAQGVAPSLQAMHLHGFATSLVMALLFFAYAQRSRARDEAAQRLASAQQAQRAARRRLVQSGLQALQARIDPRLLFDMLEAVRKAYETDAARAERLLDELIAFLRAALPRLRVDLSTVVREAELARTFTHLWALSRAAEAELTVDIPIEMLDVEFPPGVLLPLLYDGLRAATTAPCRLSMTSRMSASRAAEGRLVLALPVPPSELTVEHVRALLADLYGPDARMHVDLTDTKPFAAAVSVAWPYVPTRS